MASEFLLGLVGWCFMEQQWIIKTSLIAGSLMVSFQLLSVHFAVSRRGPSRIV